MSKFKKKNKALIVVLVLVSIGITTVFYNINVFRKAHGITVITSSVKNNASIKLVYETNKNMFYESTLGIDGGNEYRESFIQMGEYPIYSLTISASSSINIQGIVVSGQNTYIKYSLKDIQTFLSNEAGGEEAVLSKNKTLTIKNIAQNRSARLLKILSAFLGFVLCLVVFIFLYLCYVFIPLFYKRYKTIARRKRIYIPTISVVSIVIAFVLITLLINLNAFVLSIFFPPNYVELNIEAKGDFPAAVFFNVGKGYKPNQMAHLNIKKNLSNYKIALPRKRVKALRLDIIKETRIKLNSISVIEKTKTNLLNANSLITALASYANMNVDKQKYSLVCDAKGDSYMDFFGIKAEKPKKNELYYFLLTFFTIAESIVITTILLLGARKLRRLYKDKIVETSEEILSLAYFFTPKIRLSYSTVFFILGLSFGLAICFINAPFQVPDEQAHFVRAYQLSKPSIFPEKIGNKFGAFVPQNMVDMLKNTMRITRDTSRKLNPDEIITYLTNNSQSTDVFLYEEIFSPIPKDTIVYIPQAVGIKIASLLNLSPLAMLYASRTANLFVFVLLIFFGIRFLPYGKPFAFVIALMPMSLYLGASASYDSLIIASSFLYISLVLRCIHSPAFRVKKRDIISLMVLAIIITAGKYLYALVVASALIIPPKRFSSLKKYAIVMALFAITVFTTYNITTKIDRRFSHTEETAEENKYNSEDSPIEKNWNIVFESPQIFLEIVLNSIQRYGKIYLNQFVGVFGWLDTPLNKDFVNIYLVLLILSLIVERKKAYRIMLWHRLLSFFVFSIIALGVFAAMYIWSTPASYPTVIGAQGRYFIPPSLLLLSIFAVKMPVFDYRVKYIAKAVLILSVTVVLVFSLLTILNRFYAFDAT